MAYFTKRFEVQAFQLTDKTELLAVNDFYADVEPWDKDGFDAHLTNDNYGRLFKFDSWAVFYPNSNEPEIYTDKEFQAMFETE